jgi:hypothetical protein
LVVAATALLSPYVLAGASLARDYSSCDWVNGVLRCDSQAESEHFVTHSLCGTSNVESKCVTKSYEKVPGTDASTEHVGNGVSVVRGGTTPKLRELNR